MSKNSKASKVDLKPGIYVGAAVSALLLFLPYVNMIFVPAYILGPLAGAWFEQRRPERSLNFTQGALLGFYSVFYGTLAAIVFSQIAGRIVHEQLWRFENIYRLPPLLASKGLDSDTPHGWYLLMLQLTIVAILAGAIGVPSGMLGVKLFQRAPRP
ncbi:MAG: hypothetical protein WAO00_17275 [Chthoniobacterales bacterium]